MSDEQSLKIPASLFKAVVPFLITALLAVLSSAKIIQPEVAAVQTGAINRSEQNAYEISWCVGEVIQLKARVEALEKARGE